ncbi:tetratricopeptide repeat protein [Streptomyces coeruleoprunus]|uniref:Tetratricopeptide repeat protein n=1 Tax=Streptomyces coeruleoprunus TaxID=285563 RepID=A0ABV9XEY4_9ACTN
MGERGEPGGTVRNVVSGGQQGTVVQAGHIEHLVVQPPRPEEVTVAPPWGDRGTPLRGREPLLARLLAEPGVHVLYGLGGVGKTALALEAAHRFRRPHARVWWVGAHDDTRLTGGMRAVARHLGATDADLAAGMTADLVWERLSALREPWLLVLDNADDLALLDGPGRLASGTGWVRAHGAPQGLVLVTTRDGDPTAWGALPVLHALTPLPREDAVRALADRAGSEAGPDEDAAALAVRLGGLPLALDTAGRYLASVHERPTLFRAAGEPATYGDYLAALGSGDVTVDGDGTLTRIWEMSLALAESRGDTRARAVLHLLAGFADAPVPLRVLDPAHLPDATPAQLWRALQALHRLGLAELRDTTGDDGAEPVVALHPLVRDAHRTDAARALAQDLAARAAEADGRPEDIARRGFWSALVPHLLDITPDRDAPEHLWVAALCAGDHLKRRGLYGRAFAVLRPLAESSVRLIGENHKLTHWARTLHTSVLLDLGRFTEARAEADALVETCLRLLGRDAPITLRSRALAATAAQLCGDLDAARAASEAVHEVYARLLGPDDRHTLAARHNLAIIVHESGDVAAARAEYEAILAVETATLGPHHPDTLTTRHNLATALADSGERERAAAEYRAVLEARIRVLGADHPDAEATAVMLARTLPG